MTVLAFVAGLAVALVLFMWWVGRCMPAVALVLLAALPAQAQTPDERAILDLMNEERARFSVAPLGWSEELHRAAQAKADEQAEHDGQCPAHDSCDGTKWSKRIGRFYPGWVALGENAATSIRDPQVIVDGWLSSDGHWSNIVDWRFIEAGVALADGTTDFGRITWAYADFGSQALPATPTRAPRVTPTPLPPGGIGALRIHRTRAKTIVSGYVVTDGSDLKQPATLTIDLSSGAMAVFVIPAGRIRPSGKGIKTIGGLPALRMVPSRLPRMRFRFEVWGVHEVGPVKLYAAGQAWGSE
ncbi:CAP domain-containing protein [Candidatus Binatia bacterium]|nr:CAP domain-containing protein [Candidatus Binatia bacterium]